MKHRTSISEEPLWYLRGVPFATYCQTRHWKRMRERVLEERGRVCELCGISSLGTEYVLVTDGDGSLEQEDHEMLPSMTVHHISYERIGEEADEDLSVLCVACHAVVHGRANASTDRWRAFLSARLGVTTEGVDLMASAFSPVVAFQELEGDLGGDEEVA